MLVMAKVLITDEEEVMCGALKAVMTELGLSVCATTSLAQGLKEAQVGDHDVVSRRLPA